MRLRDNSSETNGGETEGEGMGVDLIATQYTFVWNPQTVKIKVRCGKQNSELTLHILA